MNFYTFSSDSYRHFARWLLVLVIAPVAVLFAVGVYLQPLNGDMTRIGFYAEREFGWNSSQRVFRKLQFSLPELFDQAGWHYDILVVGDSFSRARPESQWQNYLSLATGEFVGSLDIYNVSLNQILASREFSEHPPKVLIFEAVERLLQRQLKRNQTCQNSQALPPIHSSTPTAISELDHWQDRLESMMQLQQRGTKWQDINISYGWQYLRHTLPSRAATAEVYRMNMRPDPLRLPAGINRTCWSSIRIWKRSVGGRRWD